LAEADALETRFPDPGSRPPLYGVLVGVKDIFHVDGFLTRAGSLLPPTVLTGSEATSVSMLRGAGALMLGKTATTEFAYFEPGPTRNPHNLDHTPGGSSSGSAAAVAAGFCPLATGTQTVGSVIRPAAFCGIVGFKPSYGRIPIGGVILFSESVDHVGLFTQDVRGMALAASVVLGDWQQSVEGGKPGELPVLAVPEGAYLGQALPEALRAFEAQGERLSDAGYEVRRVGALEDIAAIMERHNRMTAAEASQVHAEWFTRYGPLYRPRTAAVIREGQSVSASQLEEGRASRGMLRQKLQRLMAEAGIDAWICPAATGPAPESIRSTGDPAMNLPWTHAGMPAITVPAGVADNGLPLGLQCVARYGADELLLAWAEGLAKVAAP
jgi:Asp-tRNA(Asn)/Glu-tRNA(Gln) amidotransferase A subunit family amidase